MPSLQRSLSRGAIAGVLGALALVLWFFIIDMVVGQPMRTPKLVAGSLFGSSDPGLSLIAFYTVMHFVAFTVVGITVAWLLDATHTRPHFLLGVVLGFLLFDLVFYMGVVVTGVNVVSAIGWPEVLIGNVIAGLGVLGYLHLTAGEVVSWRQLLSERAVLREGLVGGLIGAAAVALWFFALDLIEGRMLYTPAALGSALFANASSPAEVQTTAGMVIGYTVLHVASFVIIGVVAAALVSEAEKDPPVLLGLALLFVTFEVLMLGLVAIVASWLLQTIDWWAIVLANVIAAIAMGAYLWKMHPRLAGELNKQLEEEGYVSP